MSEPALEDSMVQDATHGKQKGIHVGESESLNDVYEPWDQFPSDGEPSYLDPIGQLSHLEAHSIGKAKKAGHDFLFSDDSDVDDSFEAPLPKRSDFQGGQKEGMHLGESDRLNDVYEPWDQPPSDGEPSYVDPVGELSHLEALSIGQAEKAGADDLSSDESDIGDALRIPLPDSDEGGSSGNDTYNASMESTQREREEIRSTKLLVVSDRERKSLMGGTFFDRVIPLREEDDSDFADDEVPPIARRTRSRSRSIPSTNKAYMVAPYRK